MSKKSQSFVDEPEVAPEKEPTLIFGAEIVRMGRGDGHSPPCLSYDGAAPAKGEELAFLLENGVTYSGTVAVAIEADGNVLVEFVAGITPVLQQ
jgi:hypothetical protein